MVAEPPDPSMGVPTTQETWSHFDNVTGNDDPKSDLQFPFGYVIILLAILCGLAGNGAVVWLLGCRLRRTPFSVYVLNLACANFTYLLSHGVQSTLELLNCHIHGFDQFLGVVWMTSYLAGLGLLVAVSSERCVSALWPLWHRCRRPARLSSAVCAGVWGLALAWETGHLLYSLYGHPEYQLEWLYEVFLVAATLALCVTGTLLIWVKCGPRRTRPTQLDVTILLSVLAFLLLGLPFSVWYIVNAASSFSLYCEALFFLFSYIPLCTGFLNPVIYFLVGSHGRQPGRAPVRDVLQRALRDEEGGAEQRGTPGPRETEMCL